MATKRDRIANDLRSAIAVGTLAPGERMPIESELMNRYAVSRSTVRWAMTRLKEEGLISIEQGRGTFVTHSTSSPDRVPRYNPTRLAKQARDANQGAHRYDATDSTPSVSTRVYFERASNQTAAQLAIDPGEEVVVRDRVLSLNGKATQLAVSRLPRALTRGTQIEDTDTGPGGLLSRLEENGHTLGAPVERVTVHRATATTAQMLSIEPGQPVFQITRTQPDNTGRVLEVNEMTLSDCYELVYEIPTE